MRQISLFTALLFAVTSIATADVVVTTKTASLSYLEDNADSVTLDLKEFFQVYAGEGPIADFEIYLPVEDGLKDLEFRTAHDEQGNVIPAYTGETVELMTYKLLDGGTYDHVFGAHPSEFEWRTETVQFQLLANDAPITVANFIQYVVEDQYDNLLVHRAFPGVVQAGTLQLSEDDDFLFSRVDNRGTIPYEDTEIDNSTGTLALGLNSSNVGSSDFFINLADNATELNFRSFYPVFGRLIDEATALPILQEMGNTNIYDLSGDGNNPRYFPSLPLSSVPLYTPFWQEKGSYLRFNSITIPPGNPDGVTYTTEWRDQDGDPDTVSDEEAANQAAFDISINGSELVIGRNDTGVGVLQVNGSIGADNETNFSVVLISYNQEGFEAFIGASIGQGGILTHPWYGELDATEYPLLLHKTQGYQHVARYGDDFFGNRTYFIYDYGLKSWLWVHSFYYPNIYAYDLDGTPTWLLVVEETGDGFNNTVPRWFFNYNTQDWITDDYDYFDFYNPGS